MNPFSRNFLKDTSALLDVIETEQALIHQDISVDSIVTMDTENQVRETSKSNISVIGSEKTDSTSDFACKIDESYEKMEDGSESKSDSEEFLKICLGDASTLLISSFCCYNTRHRILNLYIDSMTNC